MAPWCINDWVGTEYIIAGLVMLWATFKITVDFGIKTPCERWAFFRRLVYSGMSLAMLAIGMKTFAQSGDLDIIDLAYHSLLLFGIVVFPVLRAFRLISQDSFLSVWSNGYGGKNKAPLPANEA